MTPAELESEVARLRGLIESCRAEVVRLNYLLAQAEERAVASVQVYAAIDALTAAKLHAARLEKQLAREGAA